MKAFIILALVAAAHAGHIYNPIGVYETGTSQVHRQEDGIGSYSFGYDEAHTTGGSFHKETGAPGVKVGTYGLHDADGRVRVVNYVADAHGYRADIKTNEPGVDHVQDPAATVINKGGVIAAPSYAAPFVHHGVVSTHDKIVAPVYTHHGIATPVHHGFVDHKIVAPATYTTAVHHGVAPVHHGVVAPVHHGVATHHGIVAPVYNSAIHHGVVGHHKIVAPVYNSGIHHVAPIHHGIVSPVHHGIVAPHYAQTVHHGVVTPAIHHGIGYGLGYGSAIHGGLGYAGILGHVSKVHHVSPYVKVY